MLHGRATERSIIDRLLACAYRGRSGVLVVRGEPGIGKTSLLDYAAAAAGAASSRDARAHGEGPGDVAPPGAADFQVIRCAGFPPEAELPFAGLHLLLGSVLDRRFTLPQRQRSALDAAFGLRRADPHDRFLIGLAVLSILAELAESGPLLCLVDDAHWLDRASAEALVFVARRLSAERIAIIFAARNHDGLFPVTDLPEMQLHGLNADSAAALLMEHGGAGLAAETCARILAEACGNPLGLIELSAAYVDGGPAAAWPGSATLPLTDRLQKAFDGQVRRLPESTQTLLLAAAVGDGCDLAVVLEAVAVFGVSVADLAPAEEAGLICIVDRAITFRHSLVRGAVYHGGPLLRRLAVHRAVAGALRDPADADRRAWHLAAAATGPDEEVATELEQTAAKAVARSGYAAAAAAYQRAVQLTLDPTAQAKRLVLAAKASAEIGDFDQARGLATRAAGQACDPIVAAEAAKVRAWADFSQGRLPSAHRLLVDAAVGIGRHDRLRAVRLLMKAVETAWFLGDKALMTDTAGRLKAVGGFGAEPLRPLVQLMLWSAAQAEERPDSTLPPLDEVVTAAQRFRAGDQGDLAMIAEVCLVTGRNSDARALCETLVADARAEGRIGSLSSLLTCLAQALVFDGRHCDALASASEALRIAQDTGQTQCAIEANAIIAYLAAVDGNEERCHRHVTAALTESATYAHSAATPWAHWARGLLDLGRGRLDTALFHLERISQGPMRYHGSALRSIPDLVEAAVRLGQPQRAAEPLAKFSQWAQRSGAPEIEALAERCQAVAATDDPERHYLAALKLHEASFEQARTQLLYGGWLRRNRRKADARAQLRAAVDYLDGIDASPWAQRARAELNAAGVITPQPGRSSRPRLTPQELQAVRLAAEGLSNADIAAQLFLSPRTVAYHLYKAYPKLGVTSRGELGPVILGNHIGRCCARPSPANSRRCEPVWRVDC
jgi:DNA-binding CsgD family transcriptional regulator